MNASTGAKAPPKKDRTLRCTEVGHLTGLGQVTRWRMERVGTFPKRYKIGVSAVGWSETEVLAWLEARKAERGGGGRKSDD